jgi:hypothetical protein
MVSVFQRWQRRKARRIVASRRDKRRHYATRIMLLAQQAKVAIHLPGFENRSQYVHECLEMIHEKADRLRGLR